MKACLYKDIKLNKDGRAGRDADGDGQLNERNKEAFDGLKSSYEDRVTKFGELAKDQKINKDEYSAIKDWSDHNFTGTSVYKQINTGLREGQPLSAKNIQRVAKLDAVIERNALKEDVVLYRGVTSDKQIPTYSTGTVLSDKGFTATTLDPYSASDFQTMGKTDQVVFRMNVKKGTPALAIDKKLRQAATTEYEVLLKRNLKYKVDKESLVEFKGRGKIRVVDVTVLNSGD